MPNAAARSPLQYAIQLRHALQQVSPAACFNPAQRRIYQRCLFCPYPVFLEQLCFSFTGFYSKRQTIQRTHLFGQRPYYQYGFYSLLSKAVQTAQRLVRVASQAMIRQSENVEACVVCNSPLYISYSNRFSRIRK